MTAHLYGYPWIFCRDEIDLLEDELEDLYDAFQRPGDETSFESAILGEQLETEEGSDRQLSNRLGFEVSQPPPAILNARSPLPPDPFSSWQRELAQIRAHPLYQQAKRWAMGVKSVAKDGYEQDTEYAGEFFRVYANVNLVPLKIFLALCEETHEDEIGWVVAREEYRLALTYVQRILESISFMTFDGYMNDWREASRQGGRELREALAAALSRLSH